MSEEDRDIVERLRQFASGLSGLGLGGPAPLMRDAADEIERLRAETAKLREVAAK